MNRIILSGNLVNDGEIRTTSTNKEVYSGRIAVNRGMKDSDGNYITDYFNLVYWNPSDYFKNNAKKGAKAVVEGKIINRDYDAQDGTKKYITEVWVQLFEVNAKETTQNATQETTQETKEEPEVPSNYTTEYQQMDNGVHLEDSDLPF